jgi:DNA-binding PucR family transcriptional regulator
VPEGQVVERRTLGPELQVVRLIAAQQRSRAAAIARRIYTALTAEVPEYAAITDEALAADVQSVSMAGVELWLDQLRTGRMLGGRDLEPVRQGARRRARQGFDHYALLRAWRIAVRVMWSELIEDPLAQDPVIRQVLPEIAEEAMNFSDQLSLAVTDAYLEEAARIAREHEYRRSALLELILSRPEQVGSAPPAELARPHVVIVVETASAALDDLDRIGRELERNAGVVFWTVRSNAVIAAAHLPAAGDRSSVIERIRRALPALRSVERVGIGGRAEAIADTRQSYLEAQEALTYGRLLGFEGPVFDFIDVGGYALMLSDRARAVRFVDAVLAPLHGLSASWVPSTIEAYLSRQGRIKEAAAQLHVHPNTIKYRLRELGRVGPLLRDPNRSAELLMALRLSRLLTAR